MYGRYEGKFIDCVCQGLPMSDDFELKCIGRLLSLSSMMFEYDDSYIFKRNFMFDECCVCREFYLNSTDFEDHNFKTSIDIHVSFNMLKVVHENTLIHSICISENDQINCILECIFDTLQCSTGFIVKNTINRFYTYNSQNLSYLISTKTHLPEFAPFEYEYNGHVEKNGEEYIFINNKRST